MGQLAKLKKYLLLISLSSALSLFSGTLLKAEEVPLELTETIDAIATAANQQDLDKLLQYYSREFSNSDGLRYDSISTALQKLWQNYPDLDYQIILDSWHRDGAKIVAETTTTISGTRIVEGQTEKINSTIRSRQHFLDKQLISQEIISEATEVTSGNAPDIEVMAPDQAKVHEQFNFDVIVQEPLENGILLGGAIEEQTGSDRYLKPSQFELEALASGGVFKRVTAPALPGAYWLSAIIIQGDGMVTVTRRVTIEPR